MLKSARVSPNSFFAQLDVAVPADEKTWSVPWQQIAILLGLLGLAVLLQILNGAYRSEFNAYPDEPAHYVTSLMVREYIAGPHPLAPIRFAREYYQHYPKVALGHWPPFFYLVQAFWMLLFSPARMAVRLEIAFTTAVLAFSVWREFRRPLGHVSALLASALLVCLPVVQEATDEEMAESLLVLCCFWAAIYFARFINSSKAADSLWFGLYLSLAVLTKGSGWLLVLIPPIALLLTHRLKLLFRASFWYGPAVAALLCLPWQIVTLHSAERGWSGGDKPTLSYTVQALGHFGVILISICGPVLFILIALGIAVCVLKPLWSGWVEPLSSVMFALIISDWLFHSLVPAGVEGRKMIIAVPALVYFLFAGGIWLAARLPLSGPRRRWRGAALACCGALAFAGTTFSVPRSDHYGYAETARFIVADPAMKRTNLLVCSGSIGEGLLISEIAMRQPRPDKVILRGTKDLATMDWTGAHYQSRYTSPDEILHYVQLHDVSTVVIDSFPGQVGFAHQTLVDQTIAADPDYFRLLAQFPGEVNHRHGSVRVYQVMMPRLGH